MPVAKKSLGKNSKSSKSKVAPPRGRGRPAGIIAKKARVNHLAETFSKEERLHTYIYRLVKQVDPEFGLSKKAITTLNSMVLDVYRKISRGAADLTRAHKNGSLRSTDIQTAVKLTLPGELCKHALTEASKALVKYNVSRR